MVPSVELVAVLTAAAPAAAAVPVLFFVVVDFDELELLEPPHAASAITAAAPRAMNAETRAFRARVGERRATPVPVPAVPLCMPFLSLRFRRRKELRRRSPTGLR